MAGILKFLKSQLLKIKNLRDLVDYRFVREILSASYRFGVLAEGTRSLFLFLKSCRI